ncbi:MAG: hypothetical protein V3V28_03400 [Polaribacter sp.]|uniref:hypothetical protein n=1 Tax=Polaribacter sp. TaxID=1920175 RepID=UPI002F354871
MDNKQNKIKRKYFELKVRNGKGYSNYSNFLNEFSKQNEVIYEYFQPITVCNQFENPVSVIHLVHKNYNINRNEIKMRLVYSIHFLNLNEALIYPYKIINKNTSSKKIQFFK